MGKPAGVDRLPWQVHFLTNWQVRATRRAERVRRDNGAASERLPIRGVRLAKLLVLRR